MSDMEYLKSKIVQDNKFTEISEDNKKDQPTTERYTLRLRGIPFAANSTDIRKFLRPIEPTNIRLLTDDDGRSTGLAFVDFKSQSDIDEALKLNGNKMGKRYIELLVDAKNKDESKYQKTKNRKRPWEEKDTENKEALIADTGRLFVRNLPYTTTEGELTELFDKYGQLTEMNLLVDKETNTSIGLAYVTFVFPEHAIKAYSELDGRIYQGRLLHILPSEPPISESTHPNKESNKERNNSLGGGSSFKKERDEKLKSRSGSSHNWNTLFLGSNAVVDAMVDSYSVNKSDILDHESERSLAVRLALGETQLVAETKEFLEEQGVRLDVFENEITKRSKTVILVKNLPYGTTSEELNQLFRGFGSLSRVILPAGGVSALIEFSSSAGAKRAFKKMAYSEFKHLPLYLEWAPFGVIQESKEKRSETEKGSGNIEEGSETDTKIFVKNLNFSTTDEHLLSFFQSNRGGGKKVKAAIVARKHNPKDPTHPLSLGYGFVTFASESAATEAIKELQGAELDGHHLELSLSHSKRNEQSQLNSERTSTAKFEHEKDETQTKIIVRNIPFEANKSELKQLFSTFGVLKNVRIPKKVNGRAGSHRGFCFVEYSSHEDAVSAFHSLCDSTHFYGRRLVLEWAETDESVDAMRKRTARYFEGNEGAERVKRRRNDLMNELFQTIEN